MQTPHQQPGEGQPRTTAPRRSRRFLVFGAAILAVGLASGALLGGLGVAGARTATPAKPAPPAGRHELGPKLGHHGWKGPGWLGHGPFAHGPFDHGPFGHGPFGKPGMGGLHGQLTVPVPGGGSRTVAFQQGSVTSVGGSSISVKSTDGYTAAYGLDERTVVVAGLHGIADVKTGDLVGVLAIGTGTKTRTIRVLDETAIMRVRSGLFPGFEPD